MIKFGKYPNHILDRGLHWMNAFKSKKPSLFNTKRNRKKMFKLQKVKIRKHLLIVLNFCIFLINAILILSFLLNLFAFCSSTSFFVFLHVCVN